MAWVDADDLAKPTPTFPPTMVVLSGHGYHLYYALKETADPAIIEELNQVLIADIPTADKACWNSNRLLRIPGSLNVKNDKPVAKCELLSTNNVSYSVADLRTLGDLSDATCRRIRTGDARGFRSRSERDWAVVVALCDAGASDELVELLFRMQPIGDKLLDPETPRDYLKHTIERARAKVSSPDRPQRGREKQPDELTLSDEGYRRGPRLVSTFTLEPKVLLNGGPFHADDAFVVKVHAHGYTWDDVTFSRKAFNGVGLMDRECPIAAWQWLGHDQDVRLLLPTILQQLQVNGLPQVAATPVMGLHKVKDKWYFVGDTQTLSAQELWTGYSGPVCWLPRRTEHPKMNIDPNVTAAQLAFAAEWIPQINTPEVIYPLLGWNYAALLKPWLEEQGYRFPTLSVTGTRGSGKTASLLRVMMPLFGQLDAKSYDANTSKFVSLTLLGSTTSIPIAFSEFRFATSSDFLRYILLAYDTGHNPKGRGDLSTVDYSLSAPFSLDGEDVVSDPAAQQRIITVHPLEVTIQEGSQSYTVFNAVRTEIPMLGGYLIRTALRMIEDGSLLKELKAAHEDMFTTYPGRMPDRIRNNYTVVRLGVRLWCLATGDKLPPTCVFKPGIEAVYDTKTGRGRTAADDFVESVLNEIVVRMGATQFKWTYDKEAKVVYFQLAAHSWWMQVKRREGNQAPLALQAIRIQLKEQSYFIERYIHNGMVMVGVNLATAIKVGLEVPEYLDVTTMEFNF